MRWRLSVALALLCALPASAVAAEPTVDEVREIALHYAGLDGEPDTWSGRARWRNLVPRVSATVGWVDEDNARTAFNEYLTRDAQGDLLFDSARTNNDESHKDRLYYSVRAWIDFRGLIFDPAEIQASREARARSARREALVAMVHETYFERVALHDSLDGTSDDASRDERRIRMLEARLDGFTGGWFTRRITDGGAP